jgi:hypothetical protein
MVITMEEIWIKLTNKRLLKNTIIEISNTGLMKRYDGSIEIMPIRQAIHTRPKIYAYRVLAEHFIPKTEEDIALGRNHVDHITHNPINMHVNDIRNLRWCTRDENAGFDEARANKRLSMIGKNKGKKRTLEQREHISKATKEGMKKVPYEKLAYWKGKHRI